MLRVGAPLHLGYRPQVRDVGGIVSLSVLTALGGNSPCFNPPKPSGHYMYRTVVTICTASLIFNDSMFGPHSVFMCFVWIWEQTAIISLYSINWLVFISETKSVCCAVRTGYLYIIQVKLSIGSVMALAVTRRRLTAESRAW